MGVKGIFNHIPWDSSSKNLKLLVRIWTRVSNSKFNENESLYRKYLSKLLLEKQTLGKRYFIVGPTTTTTISTFSSTTLKLLLHDVYIQRPNSTKFKTHL